MADTISPALPPALSIYFPAGTAELTEEAIAALDEAAKEAVSAGAVRVVVVGYDDGAPDQAEGERVAAERAASVGNRLVDRGIDPGLVSLVIKAAAQGPSFIDKRRADVLMEPVKAAGITSGF
jgi:outer membrane protein OmpA-like peptidoglycan-associated protein